MAHHNYSHQIADYLEISPESISLFSKGRVGLYAILKALDIKEKDEVIIPAFTCVVVANAILYLGAIPIYVDIEVSTYNMDPNLVEKAITDKTKLIIAQNTFGLSPDFDALDAIATQYGIDIIEDCTHGFGGYYKGKKNGTLAKASFFSTQWNKPFSTGIGGFVVTNDAVLRSKVNKIGDSFAQPTLKGQKMLSFLIWFRKNILKPNVYWQFVKIYRWLSKYNLVVGSSDDLEVTSIEIPPNYLSQLGPVQAKEGVRALEKFEIEQKHRSTIAKIYDEALEKMGFSKVFVPDYAQHTYLKYPLLVKNKIAFLTLAEKHKIPMGEWFVSPIHPIEKDFEKWQYNYGDFAIAESISQHILNLPTDLSVSKVKAKEIVSFLQNNKDQILSI